MMVITNCGSYKLISGKKLKKLVSSTFSMWPGWLVFATVVVQEGGGLILRFAILKAFTSVTKFDCQVMQYNRTCDEL